MGYRVESYSVDELHRISMPSAVPPSLFWVLPVGNWRLSELDHVWHWFTKQRSVCNDYGLLLVKEAGRLEATGSNVNLASVGAELSDVMPAGAKGFVSPSAYRPGSRRVLVLSGGYPQPGWGLLIDWSGDIQWYEGLIERAISRLSIGEQFGVDIGVFSQAGESFRRWKDAKEPPPPPDLARLDRAIAGAEKWLSVVLAVYSAMASGEHLAAAKRLLELTGDSQQATSLDIPESLFQSLRDAQQRLQAAAEIGSVPAEMFASEIEPRLAQLIADPAKKAEVYSQLRNKMVKSAIIACIRVREKFVAIPTSELHSWAQQELKKAQSQLITDLKSIEQTIQKMQILLRGEQSQRRRDYELKQECWRETAKQAREEFHHLAGRTAELQWELGPPFLVALEDICQEGGIWARSIPWDAARMVGWKIMARNVSLGSLDLQSAARELSLTGVHDVPGNSPATGHADGSYFTDYVHYIAMTKPGVSPRTVTRDLVARLLRPTEMTRIIQSYGVKASAGVDTKCLADSLLDSCGWRASDEIRERPLARFLQTASDGKVTLADGDFGNDLRIALESFCKDVLDVVVTQLGYAHDEIWRAIDERVSSYRPSSRSRDWNEEVRQMTVGAACMILPALGSLAFSMRQKELDEFVNGLRLLATANPSSHHHEEALSLPGCDDVPGLLQNVLDKAIEVLGDLPWHLHATFSYGEQPKIVSGEAWSHGSTAPRLLRVITWGDTALGARVLLWNKNRRNPIVTDPVFVVRPKRG